MKPFLTFGRYLLFFQFGKNSGIMYIFGVLPEVHLHVVIPKLVNIACHTSPNFQINLESKRNYHIEKNSSSIKVSYLGIP